MAGIKICGFRRLEEIQYANELKPDYAGFVFAKSRRSVLPEQAALLRKELDETIPAVGVFVNQDAEWICSLVRRNIIQLVQLHGEETEQEIRQIREQAGCAVIKAVRIPAELQRQEDTRARIQQAQYSQADMLLLDGGAGGGRKFAWEQIPAGLAKPYFLAGGITAENAQEALAVSQAFALDASSAVETDGFKDYSKMKELIRRVHGI